MAAVPVPVCEASHLELRDALGFLSLHLRCSPCSLLNNPTAHWFLGTHFALCSTLKNASTLCLQAKMIAESTVITGGIRRSDDHDLNGWKRRKCIPRSDGESEPRYNADYLVEMYSTHKQAISSRCIQHTRKLSRGDVFSTQANYLVEMYSSHRLSHGDVFSKQAYYFAEKTFQRRISYGHIYSTHNISYKRCIQHCRIFCSVDVFNNAGYFAQWTYSTMQDILLRGCIQHIISRTEEACNPDYPVERAYWTQKNSHRKYIFRPDIYCICRGQHKFRQNRMSSVILYREYRSIHQPDTDGVFTSLARSVWFHQSSP